MPQKFAEFSLATSAVCFVLEASEYVRQNLLLMISPNDWAAIQILVVKDLCHRSEL